MKKTSHIMHTNPLYNQQPLPHEQYAVILTNPPFNGALDKTQLNSQLRGGKTELLFLDLTFNLLKLGGRAAIIVPSGILFGSTKAHQILRKALIRNYRLTRIIQLPPGTFQIKPPRWTKQRGKIGSGVSTNILIFSKGGGTETVHFYEPVEINDGRLTPDWSASREDIIASEYNLTPNRYRPIPEPEPVQPIGELWAEIQELEGQIAQTQSELQTMLTDLGILDDA
ncbi:MAG: N-6 DNA methylase [Chloroflexota bacterium]